MSELQQMEVFTNLGELRDWLNQFKSNDLSTVLPENDDFFTIQWFEETLSDGSTVNNARIFTS